MVVGSIIRDILHQAYTVKKRDLFTSVVREINKSVEAKQDQQQQTEFTHNHHSTALTVEQIRAKTKVASSMFDVKCHGWCCRLSMMLTTVSGFEICVATSQGLESSPSLSEKIVVNKRGAFTKVTFDYS